MWIRDDPPLSSSSCDALGEKGVFNPIRAPPPRAHPLSLLSIGPAAEGARAPPPLCRVLPISVGTACFSRHAGDGHGILKQSAGASAHFPPGPTKRHSVQ